MALQNFSNKYGTLIYPAQEAESATAYQAAATLDAAGESVSIIGRVVLEGGSGSKTISSAGGKIIWRNGGATFANAGTTLRIGINDVVVTTGLEDGTHDVYADLVGGTDTITSNTAYNTAMETGTKTIAHGDIVAVVFEMTARGGADSVIINGLMGSYLFPYRTVDTGAGPAKATSALAPMATIIFDDGTYGWIEGNFEHSGTNSANAFGSGSTPDERALIFQVPFKASLKGAEVMLNAVASGDDFEVVLYSDPLGTPTVVETITADPDIIGSTAGLYKVSFTAYTLNINTNYAIAVRPTTTNTIGLNQMDFLAANDRIPTMLGTNWSLGTRTDQTGAFTQTTTSIPIINLVIDKFDDGVQTGGSGSNTGAVWIG